jgi:hypothetical protein
MNRLILVGLLTSLPLAAFAQGAPPNLQQQLDTGLAATTGLLSSWRQVILQQDAEIAGLRKQVEDQKAALAKASASEPKKP